MFMTMLVAHLMLQALVSFTTVAQGAISAIDEPRHAAVRTAEEWQTLWRAHSPETMAPTVDFTKVVVVGVFLGQRPTGGFGVEITAVRDQTFGTVVEYRERQPDPGRLVAQVLTSPFHLVSLPRDVGPVEFRRVGP